MDVGAICQDIRQVLECSSWHLDGSKVILGSVISKSIISDAMMRTEMFRTDATNPWSLRVRDLLICALHAASPERTGGFSILHDPIDTLADAYQSDVAEKARRRYMRKEVRFRRRGSKKCKPYLWMRKRVLRSKLHSLPCLMEG